MKSSYCKVKIVVPGLGADNVYAIIKQALEVHGYVVNSVEEGCSAGPNGFLKRHSDCEVPMVLKEPETIDLIVNELPWGG